MSFSLRIKGATFTNYFTTFVNYVNLSAGTGTRTVNAGGGYDYSFNTAGSYRNTSDLYFDAGVNTQLTGLIKNAFATTYNPTICVQKANNATSSLTAGGLGVYLSYDGTTYSIKCCEGTTGNITPNISTAITWTSGTATKYLRLRRRAGVWFADASSDNSNWTAVHQFTTVDDGIFYPFLQGQGSGTAAPIYQPFM